MAKRGKKSKKATRPLSKRRSRATKTVETKRGRRGSRYSAKQQTKLLDKYHELRKAGNNAQKASKKVGVSYLTLLKWEKATGKRIKTKRGRPAGKKAKRVMSKKTALKKALKVPKRRGRPPKAKQTGLTLVTPSGFRIEGITSAELIKVLRGLK